MSCLTKALASYFTHWFLLGIFTILKTIYSCKPWIENDISISLPSQMNVITQIQQRIRPYVYSWIIKSAPFIDFSNRWNFKVKRFQQLVQLSFHFAHTIFVNQIKQNKLDLPDELPMDSESCFCFEYYFFAPSWHFSLFISNNGPFCFNCVIVTYFFLFVC